MEFGRNYNKHDWYSEVDKPNRLVYFQLRENDEYVEDVDIQADVNRDRTTQIQNKMDEFASKWETQNFRMNNLPNFFSKDQIGGGITVKSDVDLAIDELVYGSLAAMKLGDGTKKDNATIRLKFLSAENMIFGTILGKSKLSAHDYQLLVASIEVCENVESTLTERINQKQQDLQAYKDLSNLGIIYRYNEARTKKGALSAAISAITKSNYRGALGVGGSLGLHNEKVGGQMGKHEVEVGRLAKIKTKVEEKKARLQAKKAKYDQVITEKRSKLDKSLGIIQQAIDIKTERFANVLNTEFGVNLSSEEKKILIEMLGKQNDGDEVSKDGIKIRGVECKSFKKLWEGLNKIKTITPSSQLEKRLTENLAKPIKDFLAKKAIIDERLASKGLNQFEQKKIDEHREEMNVREKWELIYKRMGSFIKQNSQYSFVFKSDFDEKMPIKGGEEYTFKAKPSKNKITLTNNEITIVFKKDGKVEIKDKSGTQYLYEGAQAVGVVENITKVEAKSAIKKIVDNKVKKLEKLINTTVTIRATESLPKEFPELSGEWKITKEANEIVLENGKKKAKKVIKIPTNPNATEMETNKNKKLNIELLRHLEIEKLSKAA